MLNNRRNTLRWIAIMAILWAGFACSALLLYPWSPVEGAGAASCEESEGNVSALIGRQTASPSVYNPQENIGSQEVMEGAVSCEDLIAFGDAVYGAGVGIFEVIAIATELYGAFDIDSVRPNDEGVSVRLRTTQTARASVGRRRNCPTWVTLRLPDESQFEQQRSGTFILESDIPVLPSLAGLPGADHTRLSLSLTFDDGRLVDLTALVDGFFHQVPELYASLLKSGPLIKGAWYRWCGGRVAWTPIWWIPEVEDEEPVWLTTFGESVALGGALSSRELQDLHQFAVELCGLGQRVLSQAKKRRTTR